ncbi:MAG: hypothetical protein ACRDLT_01645 [Solirubrobacteraceae bacterium]
MSNSKMLYIAAVSHNNELRRLAGHQPHRVDRGARTPSLSSLLRAIPHVKARPAQGGTVIERHFA